MKLTVDASVVVKWFVQEPLFQQARLVLTHRHDLYAPEILLAEFANVIWKKARRGEIADPGPHFAELRELGDIVALYRIAELVDRAASISSELDHPIYDCLYLACAEAAGSALVTADRRFADKASAKYCPRTHLPHRDAWFCRPSRFRDRRMRDWLRQAQFYADLFSRRMGEVSR